MNDIDALLVGFAEGQQLTEDQAVEIASSGVWKQWTDAEIVRFQLYQTRLCMDFGRVREAIEEVLGRPDWTHECAFVDKLREEYEGKRPKPSMEDIMNLIPQDKKIIVVAT